MKLFFFFFTLAIFSTSCSNPYYSIKKVAPFSKQIPECSGLIMWDGNLIAINDSGNKPKLHAVNPSNAKQIDDIKVKNTKNVDWEALTSDSDHIYIGDFGNNEGDRENLAVYQVTKSKSDIKLVKTIPFGYRDQDDFVTRNDHNHDCEAMVIKGNYLTLFSKNRSDDSTSVYQVDINQGLQYPSKEYTFFTGYMITDASLHPPSGKIVCTAYNYTEEGFESAILVLGIAGGEYFTQHFFPLDMNHQMEGITWSGGNSFYVGSESEEGLEGSLFELKLKGKVLE